MVSGWSPKISSWFPGGLVVVWRSSFCHLPVCTVYLFCLGQTASTFVLNKIHHAKGLV